MTATRTLAAAAVLVLIAALAAFHPLPGEGASGLTVTVVSGAASRGTVVTLGDCARVSGPGADRAAATVIAQAPPAGQTSTITAGQIAAVLAGLGARAASLGGAGRCQVTTPAETIAAARIVASAVDALQAALPPLPITGGAYTVSALTAPQAEVVPVGTVLAGIAPPVPGVGVATVTVRLTQGGALVRTVPVALQVAMRLPVLVAARDLPYHTALTPDALSRETRTITNLYGTPIADPKAVAGLWTTQAVAAGSMLTDRMVATQPAVQRGDLVTITVSRGALVISASGHARQDGTIGEAIAIEIEGTGTVVQARVTGRDAAEVALP
ncbi:MAG: flagellar basal body P-ring formation chaperone FlgA [bacterium]